MGALTLGLTTTILRAHHLKQPGGRKAAIPRLPSQNPSPPLQIPNLSFSHSFALTQNHSQRNVHLNAHIPPPPRASVSWPYEIWEAGEEAKESNRRPWREFLELDAGFEVLAVGLGVAVSIAVAASRQGATSSGLPAAHFALAILVAATGAVMRHQIVELFAAVVAQAAALRASAAAQLRKAQGRARIQVDAINNKTVSSQVLSIKGSGPTAGNGAAVDNSLPSVLETRPPTVLNGTEKTHIEAPKERSPAAGTANIEAAVTDIAKCVATLAAVVANLEEKISSMENSGASAHEPVSSLKGNTATIASSMLPDNESVVSVPQPEVERTSALEAEVLQPVAKQTVEEYSSAYLGDTLNAASVLYTEAEAMQNGRQDSFANESKVQSDEAGRNWKEAVMRDTGPQVRRNTHEDGEHQGGYGSSDAPIELNRSSTVQDSMPTTNDRRKENRFLSTESVPAVITTSYSRKADPSRSVPSGYSNAQSGEVLQASGVRPGRSDIALNEDQGQVIAIDGTRRSFGPSQPVDSRVASPMLIQSGFQNNGVTKAAQDITGSNQAEVIYDARSNEPSRSRIPAKAGDGSSVYEYDKPAEYEAFSSTVGPSRGGEGSFGMAFNGNRSTRNKEVFDVPLRQGSLRPQHAQKDFKSIEMAPSQVTFKERPATSIRGLESRAAQSDGGWEDYSVARATGDGIRDEYGDMDDPVGISSGVSRGTQRSRGVNDESPYEGSDRRPGRRPSPQENWERPSSSREDSGQNRRQGGRPDVTDVDFGGNGSSTEDNEGSDGGRRQWRQGASRSADMESDADEERVTEPRAPQERASPPANASYPTERSGSYRNLPVLKSKKPEDERFEQILDEVEALLSEGREGLEGRIEVGVAERMLYEAADLCAKAVALRPSSLVAVGMWGNTLLLHGELKLRLSQNLRSMLPEPNSMALSRRDAWEAEQERLGLEATLQDVCEECEQLLVEAGRKYRLALSMDRTDMRVLYNWGLALCYRGQLIAEEGGEKAAQDADKVYLAAIDKFEAMMGLSEKYASGALLNWGLAMRDRSRLRPMGSKERRKILAQAREIFQEALRLDPNYSQARGAVAACTVELKELQQYEELPRDPTGLRDWWG